VLSSAARRPPGGFWDAVTLGRSLPQHLPGPDLWTDTGASFFGFSDGAEGDAVHVRDLRPEDRIGWWIS
jgi:hypothetical protein